MKIPKDHHRCCCGGSGGRRCCGWSSLSKSNNKETVGVVSVDSLASDYYMDDTTLDGNIVTNVTQNVTVDKDMIIKDLYVQKGDTVKKETS